MPQQLRVDESIAERSVDTEVDRNVGIPSRLPAAERVVSVNARVEITDTEVGRGTVTFTGIIRASIYYASAEDPSNVVNFQRSFDFTERVSVPGVRPGFDVTVESLISDINFYLINDREIGLEFVVSSDIEVTAPESVEFAEERPEVRFRRQTYRVRRRVKEKNYTEDLTSIERIPNEAENIKRIISVDSNIRVIDVTADYDQVTVRGVVSNDLIYASENGDVEYTSVEFPFEEDFTFRGVTPEMSPFVEVNVLESDAERTDARRVDITVRARFRVLVVQERVIEVPTGVVSPGYYPVTRTVLIERIVAEESTRFLARDRIQIPADNPDVRRVIRATGRLAGGGVTADAQAGGVLLEGTVNVNVIYVADLPDQPVYFTSTSIPFSYFVDIPEVTSDMNAFADVEVLSASASKISTEEINVRAVLDANIVVTERVRVPIVTGVSQQPTGQQPGGGQPTGGGEYFSYTVESGDTLYLIAQRYGVSMQRLIDINNIANPTQIQVGQQILIPQG